MKFGFMRLQAFNLDVGGQESLGRSTCGRRTGYSILRKAYTFSVSLLELYAFLYWNFGGIILDAAAPLGRKP